MENAQVGETPVVHQPRLHRTPARISEILYQYQTTLTHIRAASFELTVSPGAIFDGANIDGTDFKSASLDRASWKGTTGIMSALFEMATGALPPGVSTAKTG